MPVWASWSNQPWGNQAGPVGPFNPRGYHETQVTRDIFYEHVPTEVQHFLVTSTINVIARNPYVFAATVIGHIGYHLYEHFAGSQNGVSVVDITEAGGIVHPPGPELVKYVEALSVSQSRVHRAGERFRRCTVKTRRGKRCTLRLGHSSKHQF